MENTYQIQIFFLLLFKSYGYSTTETNVKF